jgi:hypothetical protein
MPVGCVTEAAEIITGLPGVRRHLLACRLSWSANTSVMLAANEKVPGWKTFEMTHTTNPQIWKRN